MIMEILAFFAIFIIGGVALVIFMFMFEEFGYYLKKKQIQKRLDKNEPLCCNHKCPLNEKEE